MSNYYDSIYESQAYSIEQATLAEDLTFNELKPTDGKFYLKILTPLVKSNDISVKQKSKLTSANYVTLTIPTYLLLHFMNIKEKVIKIPTKMNPETGNPTSYNNVTVLEGHYGTIPKGTIFFVEFLGGQAEADKAFIIGISPFKFVEG